MMYRATLGDTWLTSITQDTTTSFIPSTTRKPDFLAAVFGITDRRRLAPAGSSTKPTVNVGETEAMLDSLFNTEGLAEAIETAMGESDTRRRLGLSDAALTEASRKLKNTDDGRNTRHLQEFDDDDGVVCLLGTVIAWFVEFYIGAELGGGMLGNEVASGIGDAVRKIGCDISGLLTSKCEDFSPVLDLGDFEGLDGVVGGYLAAEIPFLGMLQQQTIVTANTVVRNNKCCCWYYMMISLTHLFPTSYQFASLSRKLLLPLPCTSSRLGSFPLVTVTTEPKSSATWIAVTIP
jgi:hypothetical protein